MDGRLRSGAEIEADDPAFFEYMMATVRFLATSPRVAALEPDRAILLVHDSRTGESWMVEIPIVGYSG